jgi:hypothetical protein
VGTINLNPRFKARLIVLSQDKLGTSRFGVFAFEGEAKGGTRMWDDISPGSAENLRPLVSGGVGRFLLNKFLKSAFVGYERNETKINSFDKALLRV